MEVSLCISSQPPDMTELPPRLHPGSGFRVWGESTNTSSLRPMGLLFWLWEEDWKKEDMRGGHSSPMRMWSQWEISPRSCVGFWVVRVPTSPSSSKQTWGVTRKIKGVSGGSLEMDKAGWRSWQECHCTQHLTVLGQSQVWIRVREEQYILRVESPSVKSHRQLQDLTQIFF